MISSTITQRGQTTLPKKIREAFGLAEEIGARIVVPTHWDMFAPNQVYREEIELLYKLISPEFKLSIYPEML